MSETAFTPGAWLVAEEAKIKHPEGTLIAQAQYWPDAHLIAAAPDLYKALANLEPYLDAIVCYASTIEEHPPNGFILETKAALAKARGEG